MNQDLPYLENVTEFEKQAENYKPTLSEFGF